MEEQQVESERSITIGEVEAAAAAAVCTCTGAAGLLRAFFAEAFSPLTCAGRILTWQLPLQQPSSSSSPSPSSSPPSPPPL